MIYKIGVIIPLSGDFAAFGEQISAGIRDANQDRVKLIFEDSLCQNVRTSNAYRKLTDINKAKYIIGPGCGSPQQIVATFLADEDQVVIIPSAATAGLYDLSNGKLFQIQYSLEKETAFMSDVIFNDGHKKALLISYQNAFSATHAKAFHEYFKGEIEEVILTEDPNDVNIVIAKARALQPDAIYIADLTYFIFNGLLKLREGNIDVPVYSMYVVEMPFVRGLVEGVVYSYPEEIDSEKGGVYSLAHQAAELLIDAIVACDDDYACVKERLDNSDKFDDQGISTREIGLFKIEDGNAVRLD